MTRHLLLYTLVPLSLLAQESSPPANPTSPARAATTAAAPIEKASGNILQDGTPVKLRLLNQLDSRTAKNGDEIQFEVVNDVVVGGFTVLRRGSPASGIVTRAENSKTMGRAGKLNFTINDISLSNGQKVKVRAFNRTSGENRTGEMVADMLVAPIVAAPFFLLIHGGNTVFPRGTDINAFVNGDLSVDLPNPIGSASATMEDGPKAAPK